MQTQKIRKHLHQIRSLLQESVNSNIPFLFTKNLQKSQNPKRRKLQSHVASDDEVSDKEDTSSSDEETVESFCVKLVIQKYM